MTVHDLDTLDFEDEDLSDGKEYSDQELLDILEQDSERPMIVKVLGSRKLSDLMALSEIPAVMIMPLTNMYTVIQEENNAMLMLMRRAQVQANEERIDIQESRYFDLARQESKARSTLETWFYAYLTLCRSKDGHYMKLLTEALVDSAGDDEGKEVTGT